MDPYIPTMQQGEEIVMLLRKHVIILLGPIFYIFMMIFVPLVGIVVLISAFPVLMLYPVKNFIVILFSIYLLILLGYGFYIWFCYYFSTFIVTEKRIIDLEQLSIFKRTSSELELSNVQDVKGDVGGVMETFLRYGNIIVETAGEAENFTFPGVGNPQTVASKILDLSEKYKMLGHNGPFNQSYGLSNQNNIQQKTPQKESDIYTKDRQVIYKRSPSDSGSSENSEKIENRKQD